MLSEIERMAQYGAFVDRAKTGKYKVRIDKQNGSPDVGNNELLPEEQHFNFIGLKEKLAHTERPKTVSGIILEIFHGQDKKIPIAIEVGREGIARGEMSYQAYSPLSQSGVEKKIEFLIDVNIVGLLTAGGNNYVQCEVEKLSNIFTDGHRANFMYLGQVLTNDDKAADLSTPEKTEHIIKEIHRSMMPGGLVIIWNQNSDLESNDFKNNGFEVLFNEGGIFVLKKI